MSRLTDHSTTLGETARAVICDIADQFQHSWNQGDGAGYAEPFAVDADYITIHGLHLTGRDTITAGISELYATLYRDSTIALEVTAIRCPAPSVIVAQVEHVLDAPNGPHGEPVTTLATIVVVDSSRGWEVVSLHNTIVAPPGPGGPGQASDA